MVQLEGYNTTVGLQGTNNYLGGWGSNKNYTIGKVPERVFLILRAASCASLLFYLLKMNLA